MDKDIYNLAIGILIGIGIAIITWGIFSFLTEDAGATNITTTTTTVVIPETTTTTIVECPFECGPDFGPDDNLPENNPTSTTTTVPVEIGTALTLEREVPKAAPLRMAG